MYLLKVLLSVGIYEGVEGPKAESPKEPLAIGDH